MIKNALFCFSLLALSACGQHSSSNTTELKTAGGPGTGVNAPTRCLNAYGQCYAGWSVKDGSIFWAPLGRSCVVFANGSWSQNRCASLGGHLELIYKISPQ